MQASGPVSTTRNSLGTGQNTRSEHRELPPRARIGFRGPASPAAARRARSCLVHRTTGDDCAQWFDAGADARRRTWSVEYGCGRRDRLDGDPAPTPATTSHGPRTRASTTRRARPPSDEPCPTKWFGRYAIQAHRTSPGLLLITAISELASRSSRASIRLPRRSDRLMASRRPVDAPRQAPYPADASHGRGDIVPRAASGVHSANFAAAVDSLRAGREIDDVLLGHIWPTHHGALLRHAHCRHRRRVRQTGHRRATAPQGTWRTRHSAVAAGPSHIPIRLRTGAQTGEMVDEMPIGRSVVAASSAGLNSTGRAEGTGARCDASKQSRLGTLPAGRCTPISTRSIGS